jgi:capsular exopolysaccharide synthesis family protein
MRRASEEAAARAMAPTEAIAQQLERHSAIALDPAALSREPFPLEMPERQPLGKADLVSPTRATESEPAAPSPPPNLTAVTVGERLNTALTARVVIDPQIDPASREQYRRLAATLHHIQEARGLQVVMIASAVQGEGKTLTATNLALTFSESYQRRVLLIDADLRRPTLHTVFGIANERGLSDGLSAGDSQALPVRTLSPRLSLLSAGRPSNDPMAGLTSHRMRAVVDEARSAFDWIIIDTPPVVLLPDANLLAAMVDGAVLVVKANSTSCSLVSRAVVAVGRERLLGIVFNRAEVGPHDGYSYYANYYGAHNSKPS